MMAINGAFGEEKGGFSYSDSYSRNGHDARVSRWNNLPGRLSDVVLRLKDVRIEHKDARKLITRYIDRPATLMYLDPPYLGQRSTGYTTDANTEHFHEELLTLSNKAKCMIFISGYDTELYKKMLTKKNGWSNREIETITKDPRGNSHKRIEMVWMNKYFQRAINDNKIPIELTEKERKENKINPERK